MSLPAARLGAAKRPVVKRIRGHQRSCYMALANGLLSGSGVYSIWITSHSGIWNWLIRVINQADPVSNIAGSDVQDHGRGPDRRECQVAERAQSRGNTLRKHRGGVHFVLKLISADSRASEVRRKGWQRLPRRFRPSLHQDSRQCPFIPARFALALSWDRHSWPPTSPSKQCQLQLVAHGRNTAGPSRLRSAAAARRAGAKPGYRIGSGHQLRAHPLWSPR